MDKALADKLAAAALSRVPAGAHVLEVEAGLGALALRAARAGARVDAVDASKAMVAALKARVAVAKLANVEARVGDPAALPFVERTFDGAYCIGVVAAGRVEMLAELRRVLKPGATVVVAATEGEAARDELVDEMMVAGFDEVQSHPVEKTDAWLITGIA
jgi:ubiquinone/menaquinone biosynthesis C-methylase UbiE